MELHLSNCFTSNKQQLFELEFWRAFIHAWNSLPIWFLCSNSVYSSFCLSFKIAHLVNSSQFQKESNFLQKSQSLPKSILFPSKTAVVVAKFNSRYLLNFAAFSTFFLAIKHFWTMYVRQKRYKVKKDTVGLDSALIY